MPEHLVHRNYDEWPPDRESREALARELFGEHMVAAYDAWLKVAADMLFRGYRYKSPTDEQREFLDWIARLSEEDRASAFAFVRQMLHGAIFNVLNELDGTTGTVLRGEVRERPRVVMEFDSHDPGRAAVKPLEVIPINTSESQEEKGHHPNRRRKRL